MSARDASETDRADHVASLNAPRAASTSRPPRMFREVRTCRCRKSLASSAARIGMPL